MIGQCKWENVKSIVQMENLKESVWYNTLSPDDIEALERCIEYQQEIDEHERQQ